MSFFLNISFLQVVVCTTFNMGQNSHYILIKMKRIYIDSSHKQTMLTGTSAESQDECSKTDENKSMRWKLRYELAKCISCTRLWHRGNSVEGGKEAVYRRNEVQSDD